jgi:two-component system, chemotaxis family, chemotaxis protein CheY
MSDKTFPKDTRILLADDSPPVLMLVQNILSNMGYLQIVRATDGKNALEKLIKSKSQGMAIDLVICDWRMPKMTGIDVLRAIRSDAELAELPFIFLTSLSDMSEVCEAIAAGADNYIVKPVDADVLTKKLESVYAKIAKKKSA